MIVTPHLLAGATAGAGLRRWWLALPVAVTSHFALDAVPHMDNHPVFGVPVTAPTPARVLLVVAIAAVSVGLLHFLARRSPRPAALVAAALAGLAPDLHAAPAIGTWLKAGPGAGYVAWHARFLNVAPPEAWLLGFGTQVVATALLLWLCLRLLRAAPDPRDAPAG